MTDSKRGKADLGCNTCKHEFRGWVLYKKMYRADPGPRRWYPDRIISKCPECQSDAISYVRSETEDHPPQD